MPTYNRVYAVSANRPRHTEFIDPLRFDGGIMEVGFVRRHFEITYQSSTRGVVISDCDNLDHPAWFVADIYAGDRAAIDQAIYSYLEHQPNIGIEGVQSQPAALYPHRNRRRHSYLTWMPYSSYRKCAACFSDIDLKQMRVHILRVLQYLGRDDRNHRQKAAELWRGFEQSLIRYGIAIALECKQRGFSDTSVLKLRLKYRSGNSKKPDWVFWSDLQQSHRAYLLLRDERRFAVKVFRRVQRSPGEWYSHRDFCRDSGTRIRREWSMDDINNIRHTMGDVTGNTDLINNNFYRQYGWNQKPQELFRYPEDNLCLA